jgi:hypothetical protein
MFMWKAREEGRKWQAVEVLTIANHLVQFRSLTCSATRVIL